MGFFLVVFPHRIARIEAIEVVFLRAEDIADSGRKDAVISGHRRGDEGPATVACTIAFDSAGDAGLQCIVFVLTPVDAAAEHLRAVPKGLAFGDDHGGKTTASTYIEADAVGGTTPVKDKARGNELMKISFNTV